MQSRLCFRDCFFEKNSIFAKILSSKITVSIFYTIISIMMTISALSASIQLQSSLWLYLLSIHIILMILVYRVLNYIFRSSIHDSYRRLMAREWSINIMALLLIIVALYLYYNGYAPDYLRDGLGESVLNASNSISSECRYTNMILKIQKEIDQYI